MPDLMKLMEDWNGYASASDIGKAEGYERKLTEVVDLLSNAKGLPAHKHEYLIREVLTTSDFPLLFGDVLQRQMLATYKAAPPVWKPFTKVSTVPRMAPHIGGKRFSMSGGDQVLDKVVEKGEYHASDRVEKQYDITVDKYGRQFDISLEAMINDDLNALKDTPTRFANAAMRTEHHTVDSVFVYDCGGAVTHAVSGQLYSTVAGGMAEINQSAGALTIGFLEQGVEAMAGFRDINNNPIYNRAKFLVVPPALEMTALQILKSTEKMWAAGAVAYPTTNVIAQYGLQLIVDPYLPIIATANGHAASANTQWYLFSDPKDIVVLEAAHLAGHESPEICMKASDKVSVGGGAIGPMAGDFATDNIFYRVRLIFGATKLDWRGTYIGGAVG